MLQLAIADTLPIYINTVHLEFPYIRKNDWIGNTHNSLARLVAYQSRFKNKILKCSHLVKDILQVLTKKYDCFLLLVLYLLLPTFNFRGRKNECSAQRG